MSRASKQTETAAFFLTALGVGGGERVVLTVMNTLAAAGHPIDLLVIERKGRLLDEIDSRVNIIELSDGRIFRALFPLMRYLRTEKPKVVLATAVHPQVILLIARFFAFSQARIVLRIGIPLSIRFAQFTSVRDKLIGFLAKLLFPFADCIIANSQGIAQDSAKTLYMRLARFTVIHNPVRIDVVRKGAGERPGHPWLKDKQGPVIVAAGRLREQKDFATLIRALALTEHDVRLIILGSGDQRDVLETTADAADVRARVDFPGSVENPYAYMAHADVFALSSRYEGFPNVLLEAMAAGAAVVATDCSYGPREILAPDLPLSESLDSVFSAEYGILVSVSDANALAEAFDGVLDDTERAASFRQRARERAADFAVEEILPHYERALGISP